MFDIPYKYQIEPGTIFKCKSPVGRTAIAAVLAHDDEHTRIVHIALIVYGPEDGQNYSIGLVPIEYQTLLNSAVEIKKPDPEFFRADHGLYAHGQELWLDSQGDDHKGCFTVPIHDIVEMKEQGLGPNWGKHFPAFFPVSSEYLKKVQENDRVQWFDRRTGSVMP